jgi:amidase
LNPAFLPAHRLAARIRQKRLGCLELLDHYLERVEAHNPELNAIVVLDTERARKQARAADRAQEFRASDLGRQHQIDRCDSIQKG